MSDFKIGDKVKVLTDRDGGHRRGQIGKVVGMGTLNSATIGVEFDSYVGTNHGCDNRAFMGRGWYFTSDNLEIQKGDAMKFNLGDTVKVLNEFQGSRRLGQIGKVCHADSSPHDYVGVEFEIAGAGDAVAHNCGGRCKKLCGWYFKQEHLEKVDKMTVITKIGSYEVKVIDNKTIKVGCQTVTLDELNRLTAMVNSYVPPLELKVGAFVKVANKERHRFGQIGKVIKFTEPGNVDIEFSLFDESYSSSSTAAKGHGQVIGKEDLEVVK